MKNFWTGFLQGTIIVGFLPCWLIASVWHRYDNGHWRYVSPEKYADHAAATSDWVCICIAVVCWILVAVVLPAALALLF